MGGPLDGPPTGAGATPATRSPRVPARPVTHLLIPAESASDRATMWVAAVDSPTDPTTLELVASGGARAAVPGWDGTVRGGNHTVQYARVSLSGLTARSRQRVELRRAGQVLSTAHTTTLPDRLPGLADRPFTILLGSCFARQADGGGTVGRAYSLLPADAKPDVKILCGDQVYLDAPSFWTIVPATNDDEIRRRLIEIYLAAWTQAPGFQDLLADGPNLFTSDDHDYWNNAPHWSATVPASLDKTLRETWWTAAHDLYRAFQRPMPPGTTIIRMDGLSVLVADTRTDRDADPKRGAKFMSTDDLQAVSDWAGGLTTPGCLVLGQLLFTGTAGWKGRFTDYGLPDFPQYADLLAALDRAAHSVVILTGDVHFGRVAVCEVTPDREIVEVVASPLSLVAPIPKNDWHKAPDLYPAEAIPGRVQRPIRTEGGYALNSNHFATVEFTRGGANRWTRLRVRAWPTSLNGALPVATREYVHWVA
jgi:hypothetical protein